jgi:hypothetical protein
MPTKWLIGHSLPRPKFFDRLESGEDKGAFGNFDSG